MATLTMNPDATVDGGTNWTITGGGTLHEVLADAVTATAGICYTTDDDIVLSLGAPPSDMGSPATTVTLTVKAAASGMVGTAAELEVELWIKGRKIGATQTITAAQLTTTPTDFPLTDSGWEHLTPYQLAEAKVRFIPKNCTASPPESTDGVSIREFQLTADYTVADETISFSGIDVPALLLHDCQSGTLWNNSAGVTRANDTVNYVRGTMGLKFTITSGAGREIYMTLAADKIVQGNFRIALYVEDISKITSLYLFAFPSSGSGSNYWKHLFFVSGSGTNDYYDLQNGWNYLNIPAPCPSIATQYTTHTVWSKNNSPVVLKTIYRLYFQVVVSAETSITFGEILAPMVPAYGVLEFDDGYTKGMTEDAGDGTYLVDDLAEDGWPCVIHVIPSLTGTTNFLTSNHLRMLQNRYGHQMASHGNTNSRYGYSAENSSFLYYPNPPTDGGALISDDMDSCLQDLKAMKILRSQRRYMAYPGNVAGNETNTRPLVEAFAAERYYASRDCPNVDCVNNMDGFPPMRWLGLRYLDQAAMENREGAGYPETGDFLDDIESNGGIAILPGHRVSTAPVANVDISADFWNDTLRPALQNRAIEMTTVAELYELVEGELEEDPSESGRRPRERRF